MSMNAQDSRDIETVHKKAKPSKKQRDKLKKQTKAHDDSGAKGISKSAGAMDTRMS